MILFLAVAMISCRTRKVDRQSTTSKAKSDSIGQSFKSSSSDSLFKQSDVDFTTYEYEYPAATPEEKAKGITPKPRLKKKTVGHAKSTEDHSQKKQVDANQAQVKKETATKTVLKHIEVKPASGSWLWLILGIAACAVAVWLLYKFSIVGKIKKLFV